MRKGENYSPLLMLFMSFSTFHLIHGPGSMVGFLQDATFLTYQPIHVHQLQEVDVFVINGSSSQKNSTRISPWCGVLSLLV